MLSLDLILLIQFYSFRFYTYCFHALYRFAATLYPFSALNRCLKGNSNLVLVFGWILATILGTYPLIYTKVTSFQYQNTSIEYHDCRLQEESTTTSIFTSINFVSTFVIPLLIMTATYGTIAIQLFYYRSPQQTDTQINKIKVKNLRIKYFW